MQVLATEGVSGMIPRQEYEILAFMHEFYRWPEILRMTTDEVGAQGILDIGATARREIGTKINAVHDWSIGAVGSVWAAAGCWLWKRSARTTTSPRATTSLRIRQHLIVSEAHNPRVRSRPAIGSSNP